MKISSRRGSKSDTEICLPAFSSNRIRFSARAANFIAEEGGARAIVTYKGPASREVYKSREEIEFEVSDAEAFRLVLERLGYRRGFRYEKYRATFAAPEEPGLITLDETPIGVFLELEGPAEWIDGAALRLGFSIAGFLTVSYPGLYRKHREQHPNAPANMTFDLDEPYTSHAK